MFVSLLERATEWQIGFQIPASPIMEGIVNFHHDLFFFLVMILTFVVYMLARCIQRFKSNKDPIIVIHAPTLEIVWTIIPALILIVIAIPSFSLLYSMDEMVQPLLTIKVIGHQWYWSYEFIDSDFIFKNLFQLEGLKDYKSLAPNLSDNVIVSYDSYMVSTENIKNKYERLLKVDNKLYLPVETNVRLLITSADVLHSWAVPALGIKLDACPGRLNQTALFIKRPGTFYGQCSELCGVNHGFMPINVTALDLLGDGSKLDISKSESTLSLLFFFLKKKFA
jgi:cytochrome c oxidase subunit 2